jgi:adenylate kinase
MPPFAQAIKHGVSASKPSSFNLMLFGAPGVGKGTFGKLIQRDFDFKPFSTGDYFRQVVKMAQANKDGLDAFTLEISEILNSGKLVDDQIVIDIVKQLK